MRNILIIVSVIVVLLICHSEGICQKQIVTGFNSDERKGGRLVFFREDLVISRISILDNVTCMSDLRVFRQKNVERIFINNGCENGITVIDLETGEIISTLLSKSSISSLQVDDTNVYVVNGLDELFIIDAETLITKKKLKINSARRKRARVIPLKGGLLCVAKLVIRDKENNAIQVFTMDSSGRTRSIGNVDLEFLGIGNIDIVTSNDKNRIYVPSNNTITEFNLTSGKKTVFPTEIKNPTGTHFDDATNTVCVLSNDGFISLINVATKEVRKLGLGSEPISGSITGDRNGKLFINIYKIFPDKAIVAVFDLITGETIAIQYEAMGDCGGIDIVQ